MPDVVFPRERQSDTVVLACAGPSLTDNLDGIARARDMGLDVAVVNYAYQVVPKFDIWFAVDGPHKWSDEHKTTLDYVKVVPSRMQRKYDSCKPKIQNFVFMPYQQMALAKKKDQMRHFCDRKLPIIKDPHKGMIFSQNCLAWLGYKTCLLVGSDLKFSRESNGYCPGITAYNHQKVLQEKDSKTEHRVDPYKRWVKNQTKVYEKDVYNYLRQNYKYAEESGYRIVNCCPGGKLEPIMGTMTLDDALKIYNG